MDKWEELKKLIDGHMAWPVIYSHSKDFERGELMRVKEWMEYLEKKESDNIKLHVQKMAAEPQQQEFLFTGIPSFDQKTWDRILEEKGLQGLS